MMNNAQILAEEKLRRIVRDEIRQCLSEINHDMVNRTYQVSQAGKDAMANAAKDSVGANALKGGISGKNLPVYMHRLRKAKEEADNGDATKLNNMGGMATYNEVERMYRQAQNTTRTLRNTRPEGSKIDTSNRGKKNSASDNGIITYYNE